MVNDNNRDDIKIDFVILWVDGNDPKWLKEKEKFLGLSGDKSKNRFREWDNLQFLFRGIEKFAPWVNKVFFVTWGHVPKWLNVQNQKLKIVKHEEFIDKKYLPTFNSNVIEMNLHNIKELSNHFVLLNDDLFFLKEVKKTDFFINNKPRDMYIQYKKKNCSKRHIQMRENHLSIINKYFDKKKFIKNNMNKVFNFSYGLNNINNLINFNNNSFNDFYSCHLNQNLLKDTYNIVWEKEKNALELSCKNKFRASNDLGQQLCRYFQLLSGNFVPYKSLGKYFVASDKNKELLSAIKKQKYKIICINDSVEVLDFEKTKNEIKDAFENILNEKCSFEK